MVFVHFLGRQVLEWGQSNWLPDVRAPRNKPSLTQPNKFLSCSVAGSEKDHGTNKCLFGGQSGDFRVNAL
jgi:hypothetical protein